MTCVTQRAFAGQLFFFAAVRACRRTRGEAHTRLEGHLSNGRGRRGAARARLGGTARAHRRNLEPELIFALAERNRIELPYRDLDDLRGRYEFGDLVSFLDLYYANMEVLRTAQDFADLARAYFARAARAGITRAEFFFDPQAHTARGVELREVVDGLADAAAGARREYGIDAR